MEKRFKPGDRVVISKDSSNYWIRGHEADIMEKMEEGGVYDGCYKVSLDDGGLAYVHEDDMLPKGICRICGCTENDPCHNPEYGYCWWVDKSHTLCSHCAEREIAGDPQTVHCVNTQNGELPWDDDVPDVVMGILSDKTEGEIYSSAGLREDLGLDSLDITETMMELEHTYGFTQAAEASSMETVTDLIAYVREYGKEL